MSEMEAIYGTYKKSNVTLLDDEDLYDARERLNLELVEVDGQIYEIEVLKELDACGFSMSIEPSDQSCFIALWYNGGAGIHEVVESIIREANDND